jgi:hypothetical protein
MTDIERYSTRIPIHILILIEEGDGSSFKNAIKLKREDAFDFVDLEYRIIKYHSLLYDYKYNVLEQELFISKRHRVYDIIKIKKDDKTIQKFYFDITDVFGLYQ